MYNKELVDKFKRLNYTIFEEVYSIKFEPHHGCNRDCTFCGISRLSGGSMTKETLINTLDGVTDRLRKVSFSLHGEPTLNKNLPELISIVRERFPKVQITVLSNFDLIDFDYLLNLYDVGVSQVHLDLYSKERGEYFFNGLKEYKEKFNSRDIPVYDYYNSRINTFSYKGANKRFLVFVTDYDNLNTKDICTRNIHTWGGNLKMDKWLGKIKFSLNDFPLKKTCTEPLKYATVRHNGDVTLCCRDAGSSIVLGNVNKDRLIDIWQSKEFHIVRMLNKIKDRSYIIPCILCNYRSFRDGLSAYWGEEYSKKEVLKTLDKIQSLDKREVVYTNLVELSKIKKLPNHIINLLEK